MVEVFLAPHLDDAALSAGGSIHRLAAAGARVVVLTVCAGPPPEADLSPYALSLHARWGQPPAQALASAAAMVARRRGEDRAACRRLGAAHAHLRLPDLIYRRRADGGWAAESDAQLFAGAAGVDEATVEALARRLRRRLGRMAARRSEGSHDGHRLRLWTPLGIGDHVDHHLCRRAAERLAADRSPGLTLRYYEDYPYAGDAAARARALAAGPAGGAWRAVELAIGDADLAAKLDAVACFGSQISSFWTDEGAMRRAITAFGRAPSGDGWRERFWEVAEGASALP